MGISSSKTKKTTTSSTTPLDQYAPYINQGLQSAQGVMDANQANLGQMSQNAYGLFNTLAGTINNPGGFVSGAQQAAANIFNGNGASAATFDRLQQAGAADPSIGLLTRFAGGSTNPAAAMLSGYAKSGTDPSLDILGQLARGGSANPALVALQGMMVPGTNPADAQASAVAGGKYLNAQPSADFYKDTLSGKYLNGNPYLDAMVRQSNDSATKAVNQRFGAAGMGAGMSTPYADLLSRNLADSETKLRYGAYNDELSRMGAIGAQSDAVWGGERNRMDAANGLVASNYNANQDRALAAANDLGNQHNAAGQLQLAAAQGLGSQYMAGQTLGLNAATTLGNQYLTQQGQQIDAAQALGNQYAANNTTALGAANGSVSSILQALGLTGGLAEAQYAGVGPALQALSSAASIPYTGVNNYADLVNGLTSKYGNSNSTETTTSGGLTNFLSSLSGLGSALSGAGSVMNGLNGLGVKFGRQQTGQGGQV
jgi:hypothetical protein